MPKRNVHDFEDGSTSINGRVIEQLVEKRLSGLRDARRVKAKVRGEQLIISVKPQHGVDPVTLRQAIDDRLDLGFWIDSGVADLPYTVTVDD